MQRVTTDDIESKLDALEDKIDSTAETQANSITELQAHIDEGNKQNVVAVKSAQDETTGRLGWLGNCLFELKGIVSEIFTQSGTTLSGIQRIEQTLSSRSDLSLIRTFTLEDPLGRITQIDLVYVSSFDALDAMLEICFRTLPGHDKVAKKDYVFQDEKTNREIKRSTPWSCALLPGQHVQMGLLFRKRSSRTQRHYCPYCHLVLAQSQEGFIPWCVPLLMRDFANCCEVSVVCCINAEPRPWISTRRKTYQHSTFSTHRQAIRMVPKKPPMWRNPRQSWPSSLSLSNPEARLGKKCPYSKG
jgi:hypothetical protein